MRFLEPGYCINPMVAIVASLCHPRTALGCKGEQVYDERNIVHESFTNNTILGTFPGVEGIVSWTGILNWDPFVPNKFGIGGSLDPFSISLSFLRLRISTTQESTCLRQNLSGDTQFAMVPPDNMVHAPARYKTHTMTVTAMAVACGNGPRTPHTRDCASCGCVGLMDDNPPSKPI